MLWHTRDILHMKEKVPDRRMVRQTIIATGEQVDAFGCTIASPYVAAVESDSGCTIGDLTHTEVDTRFTLTLNGSIGPGLQATYSYCVRYAYPDQPSQECRGFSAIGLRKAQIYVVFDPEMLPRSVFSTSWVGPSDGTIRDGCESPLTPGAVEVHDRDNNRWVRLEHTVVVDTLVRPGTTFGIRWLW